MKLINPANGTTIAELSEDTVATLSGKWAKLKEAQPAWAAASLPSRISIVRRFAALLAEQKQQLAATLTSEVGKPLAQSINEINGAIARINWLADHAHTYLSPEPMQQSETMTEEIIYEPLGVIANISAWNYPYLVGVNVFVPALLAGNAVLYKPSEYAALTGLAIERLWLEAGLPENVLLTAIGGAAVGDAVLDMELDGYFFTGSYRTGQYIYEKVAKKMVPCQCELGGKDPLYVADDVADIKAVAAGTADGAFYNNGQSCCAVERIYVHEKVYDEYINAFVAEVKSWKIGDPLEAGVYIGPLSRQAQIQLLQEQVKDAVDKGAALLTGGQPIAGAGYYFEPTVLINTDHQMLVMQEESFGPIIGIMKVKDDQEALEKMNDTAYGLTASVYTASQERARHILSQTNTGTGYWNCCDRVSAALPWSGRKHSGFGATLSHAGLRAFTRPKGMHWRQPG